MSFKSSITNYLGKNTTVSNNELWTVSIYDATTMEEVAIIENVTSPDVGKHMERNPDIYFVDAFCGNATCDNQETDNGQMPF